MSPLGHRVALLEPAHPGGARDACAKAVGALAGAGRSAELVRMPVLGGSLLARRGFPAESFGAALAGLRLHSGAFELAHAFEPLGAVLALDWRRRGGGPVVLTLAEPPSRSRLADRRGRLDAWTRVIAEADAIVAASEESRAAARRWLALDTAVVAPGDGAATDQLYAACLTRAGAQT